MMIRFLLVLFFGLMAGGSALAAGPWSGQWQITWRDGGSILILDQTGSAVAGSYNNGRGQISGRVTGDRFEGESVYDGVSERLSAVLLEGGASFAGRTGAGDWLNGVRLEASGSPLGSVSPNLASPRATMKSFLSAGNLGQEGSGNALAWVMDAIDFGNEPGWRSRDAQFTGAEQLFDLLDLATFSLADIPDAVQTDNLSLSLPRPDAKQRVMVDMRRGPDGKWRIVMPAPDALRAGLDGGARPADAFRQMQNPRDTLHAFLDGMAHWDSGGEAEAISTLDLSQIPDVLRFHEGSLIAQYLVRVIDQVGNNVLQSVPNAGADREPFVFFENPAGRVVIEPVGNGADTRWKFSRETVRDLRNLYREVEKLPSAHALPESLIPRSAMFAIRDAVAAHAPALLEPVFSSGRVEYWQLLGALTMLCLMITGALVLRRLFFWLLTRHAIKHHIRNPRRLGTALGLGAAFAIGAPLVLQLGLPAATRQYTLPAVGTLLISIMAYAGWQLIAALTSIIEKITDRTETPIDNILLTFVAGVARLSLVVAAGLALSQLWSLPATGLLAGLGVSGLAVAFASKETVANVFGAGILLGDRPFRKGDRIIAGDVNGWVEAVGLRSTRIRTLDDSLLTVPNGKLADMTVNNLGARRRRAFSTTLLVTGGATPQRLQALKEAIAKRIAADPIFVASATEVNITGINASGIQIELITSLSTTSGRASREATHQLFLDLMDIAQAQGLSLSNGMKRTEATEA